MPAKKTAAHAPEDSAQAFADFLPEAQKLPAASLRPFRGDPTLALHNIDVGLAAVQAREDELKKLPAPFHLATMKSMHRLGLAVVYAAAQIDRSSPGTTRKLLKRATELRDLLLTAAVALQKSGVLPAAPVKKILAGSGVRDQVQDCVDLAQLFRDHASVVTGKTAITKAEIDEAAAVGNELLGILKPARAKRSKVPDGVRDAVEARDRLWTLLCARHADQLRRAGMWLWGDGVDAHVPPLLSSASRRGKKAAPDGGGGGAAAKTG